MPPSIKASHGTPPPSPDRFVGALPPDERTTSKSTIVEAGSSSSSSDEDLEFIRHALPTSTKAERLRFLSARNGDTNLAIKQLKQYIEWRNRHCDGGDGVNEYVNSSMDHWTYATRRARQQQQQQQQLAVPNEIGRDRKSENSTTMIELPCTLFMLEHTPLTTTTAAKIPTTNTDDNERAQHATSKNYYLQHLPARIDTTLASTSIYALSLAIYLERILDRRTADKITLIIDVRSGYGWANIKAIHLLPFIQSTVKLLSDLHPLRLERCIIFPVPKIANLIWKAVTPLMGKDTVDKICLVSGPAGSNDGVPKKLSGHLDNELIRKLEETRSSCLSRCAS